MITESDGITNRQRYIFDVMNDVTKIILMDTEKKYLLDRVSDEKDTGQVTYIHGKLVATDELDKAILKNFQTCGSKELFMED